MDNHKMSSEKNSMSFGLLIWTIFLIVLLLSSLVGLYKTWTYHGSEYVPYETESGRLLTEVEFKRHCYASDGFLLCMSIFLLYVTFNGHNEKKDNLKF